MKNLRKLLAVIVVVALMATFMIPAFAEETTLSDAEICETLGMLKGTGDGVTDEYLASATERNQAAIMFLRLQGLEDEALAYDGEDNFDDADELWSGGRAILAYLKANPDLGWQGVGDNKFEPRVNIDAKSYYKVMLEALGYKQGVDFEWAEVLEFAAEKGLSAIADVEELTNDDIATATVEALKATVAAGDMTLIEKLVADGLVDEDAAIEAGLIAGEVAIKSVSAIGAKKLEVNFNREVDTAKAKFAVKKGTINVNIAEVNFAADKKSAVLELASKLTKGDYTITVSGLTDEALSFELKGVLDDTATSIEILADKVAAVYTDSKITSATISYKVLNQYGEDITADAPAIEWNTSFGGISSDTSTGVITITAPEGTQFLIGQTGVITGVMTSPVVVVTKTVTVGTKATVDAVTFDSLYHDDGKTINTGSTYSEFIVLFEAKDQYGNKMEASAVESDMVLTSTNPAIFTVAETVSPAQGPDSNKLGIALGAPVGTAMDGAASLRMISKSTGKVFEFAITVAKKSTIESFTMSAPAKTVAVNETVDIPFTAIDQNGVEVTAYSVLYEQVTFPSKGGSNLKFENDVVNKKAVLKYTAPAEKGSYILMSLTPGGKTSQLIIEVKDAAEAGYIAGLKSTIVSNVAIGGKVTLDKGSFLVKDKYGRDFDITTELAAAENVDNEGKYKLNIVKASASNINTSIDNNDIDGSDIKNSVVITGDKKGTTAYIAKIYVVNDAGTYELVKGSEFTFNVVVTDKADIVSYEIGDLPTLFDQAGADGLVIVAADYDVDLEVFGVKSDGSKVAMPASDYSVRTTNEKLTYDAGKLTANGLDFGTDKSELTATIIATVDAADTAVVLTKEVKISNVKPDYATLKLDADYDDTGVGKYEREGLISVVLPLANADALGAIVSDAVIAKDQYGVELVSDEYTLIITNMAKATDGTPKTIAGYNEAAETTLAAEDTFNVTAITGNGKTIQFKVVCK